MAYATNVNPNGGSPGVDGSGIAMPGYVPLSGPALTKMSQIGLSDSQSPWALAATSRETQNAKNARDNAAQTAAGATAGTNDQLAMTGGLSSGARERAAEGGQKDYLSMVQGTSNQENLNKLQINENDQQNKLQTLGTVANTEVGQNQAMNAYNQNMYQQQMSAWAANQQAAATESAGKGGK